MKTSKLYNVIKRELYFMFSRPLYIFATIICFALCCVFYLTVLDEGIPEKLPVGIVDADQSAISRTLRRELDAGQAVEVVQEYTNYTSARQALQRGEIYAFLYIPNGLYDDLLAFRQPTITLYATSAYTLAGTLAYKQLMTLANLASGAVQREVMRGRGLRDYQIMPLVQPVVVDTHILGNPWVNYSVYLSTTILPGTLGLMVLLLSVFSITHELKTRTAKHWLSTADNNIYIAIIGKMIPYTVIFTILGIALNTVLFKFLHFPMEGSFGFMLLSIFAYIVAMQAAGIFIVSMLPISGITISLSALYGTLCFTLAGFSYPVEAMLPPFKALTWLVPLRHYYIITVDQMLMGLPVSQSFTQLAILFAALLFPLPFLPHIKTAILNPNDFGN